MIYTTGIKVCSGYRMIVVKALNQFLVQNLTVMSAKSKPTAKNANMAM